MLWRSWCRVWRRVSLCRGAAPGPHLYLSRPESAAGGRPGGACLREGRRVPAPDPPRDPHDVAKSYDLSATAFVTKPVDFESFMNAVRQVDDFFLTVARLAVRSAGSAGGAEPPRAAQATGTGRL